MTIFRILYFAINCIITTSYPESGGVARNLLIFIDKSVFSSMHVLLSGGFRACLLSDGPGASTSGAFTKKRRAARVKRQLPVNASSQCLTAATVFLFMFPPFRQAAVGRLSIFYATESRSYLAKDQIRRPMGQLH